MFSVDLQSPDSAGDSKYMLKIDEKYKKESWEAAFRESAMCMDEEVRQAASNLTTARCMWCLAELQASLHFLSGASGLLDNV